MVSDADAIKSAATIEINHLRERQPAIRVVGVDVKIAKQHARRSGPVGVLPQVATGSGFKELERSGPAADVAGFFEDQFGYAQGGVRPADLLQVVPPFLPLVALVGEGLLHEVADLPVSLGDYSHTQLLDQPRVTFLLSRNHLIDDHRSPNQSAAHCPQGKRFVVNHRRRISHGY